jgi:hypothetical protein
VNTAVQAELKAASWGADQIDVFTWGTDLLLLHKNFDEGVWTPNDGFENLGDKVGGPPKGFSDAVGILHVVTLGKEGSFQHLSFTEGTGKWSPEGGFDNFGMVPS